MAYTFIDRQIEAAEKIKNTSAEIRKIQNRSDDFPGKDARLMEMCYRQLCNGLLLNTGNKPI
jgi:hypothetical protein